VPQIGLKLAEVADADAVLDTILEDQRSRAGL
jgi:hypothetical protein